MSAYLLCVALLLGQASPASLHGTVRDSETGTPVQGASVELLDGSRRSMTDAAGHYSVLDVPAGPRHMKVSGLGYRSRTLHVFVPAEGGIRVDVALLPQPIPLLPVEASVAASPVRGHRELGDRARRVGSRTVTHDDVRANPSLAEADVFEALRGAGVGIDPESPNGLHVRGGAGEHNLFSLDGIPIFSPYHATGQFGAIAPDAISRIDLHAGVPPAASGGGLAGVVDIRARSPNRERLELRGAATPTAVRVTADGPAGLGGGLLLSGGWGQPGFLAPSGESSYVRGSFAHGLVRGEWPLANGLVWIVGFRSDNALRMPNVPTEGGEEERPALGPATELRWNRFVWHSHSYGIGWESPIAERAMVEARVWYADLNVASDWWAVDGPLGVSSRRGNLGSRLQLTVDGNAARSFVGVALGSERTRYAVTPLGSIGVADVTEGVELRAEPTVLSVFAEHQRALANHFEVLLGLRGNHLSGVGLRLAPRGSVRWMLSPSLAVAAGYARTYQWVQSLRNSESLIVNLLSPDLPIGTGADGVPVARADQFSVAVEVRPVLGVEVGLEAYVRALDGLVLVAPSTGHPFAVERFSVGSGETWGLGLDLDVKRARYRATASYGFGSVGNEVETLEYRPGFAISHTVTGAVAYYPAAQLELRSAILAEFGRPTTVMEGPFVWEACSFLEGGCEAEGSPQRTKGPLGADRLPAYARLDVGARKHWHSRLLGRDGEVAIFATLSNVLWRENFLGYVMSPETGKLSGLPMRPFSPLTAGLEWRF